MKKNYGCGYRGKKAIELPNGEMFNTCPVFPIFNGGINGEILYYMKLYNIYTKTSMDYLLYLKLPADYHYFFSLFENLRKKAGYII